MTDFTWNISFQLTGSYAPAGGATITNQTATVTGTIVTDSDSGILHQSDFLSYAFTYSAPAVGFSGSAVGGPFLSLVGDIFSTSGDTLSYVFDPVAPIGAYAFFGSSQGDPSQVAFGIDLFESDFVQGDIRLQNSLSDQLDGIVTQPFQIGTEVVGTLSDISEIGTNDINLDLSAIFNVGGNVTISNNDQLVSIDLSHLLSVGGNFTLTKNGALLTIGLPSLTTVTGNVEVTDDASLGTASFDSLTATGSVNFSNDAALDTLSLGSLATVTGSVDVTNDAALGTVSLGSLATVTGSVNVTDDASLGTVSLGGLATVTGSVNVTNDDALGTISLGSLSAVTGSVNVTDDPSLTTIDLSALLQAGAVVISNDGVITLDLSKLVTAGGDVSITDNTHLLTVDLPSLTSVDGNVGISGDSSLTSVDMSSLATVAGDVTINSAADATLDASALGPGGGTVKLIGDNLTTTIELGSLAHMGGTLTISSADGVTLTSHAGLAELDIAGTNADNTLIGSLTTKNVIDGAGGNDIMTGGAADDTFVFDFSVSQQTESHHDFISLSNITSVAIGDSIYYKPAPTASITAWNNWNAELTSWANSQPNNNGGDDFHSFTNSNHTAKNVGTIQLIDGYFHNYNSTVTSVTGDGFDTITNFANSALTVGNGGGGNDALLFDGLSNDPTAANYWGNVLTSTTADGNTTIHVHDVANHGADVSTITLLGVTTDIADLVHSGAVQFDHAGWLV